MLNIADTPITKVYRFDSSGHFQDVIKETDGVYINARVVSTIDVSLVNAAWQEYCDQQE